MLVGQELVGSSSAEVLAAGTSGVEVLAAGTSEVEEQAAGTSEVEVLAVGTSGVEEQAVDIAEEQEQAVGKSAAGSSGSLAAGFSAAPQEAGISVSSLSPPASGAGGSQGCGCWWGPGGPWTVASSSRAGRE